MLDINICDMYRIYTYFHVKNIYSTYIFKL